MSLSTRQSVVTWHVLKEDPSLPLRESFIFGTLTNVLILGISSSLHSVFFLGLVQQKELQMCGAGESEGLFCHLKPLHLILCGVA